MPEPIRQDTVRMNVELYLARLEHIQSLAARDFIKWSPKLNVVILTQIKMFWITKYLFYPKPCSFPKLFLCLT